MASLHALQYGQSSILVIMRTMKRFPQPVHESMGSMNTSPALLVTVVVREPRMVLESLGSTLRASCFRAQERDGSRSKSTTNLIEWLSGVRLDRIAGLSEPGLSS